IEELTYCDPDRRDLEPWERFVHPTMSALRSVQFPSARLVLEAAKRPWAFEVLWLDVARAEFQAACTSPMLPRLRCLGVRGAYRIAPEPAWLAGLTRCPRELTMLGVALADAALDWLEHAEPLPLDALTLLAFARGATYARFTRDASGALTRLAIEIR